jgi:hypothetical protein
MLTDRHVDAYIEDNIRCHANGSIDYGFYDQRAREGRGIAFRSACRSVTALVRRLTALFAGSRTERQPLTKRIQAQPTLQLVDHRRETSAAARSAYSEAA